MPFLKQLIVILVVAIVALIIYNFIKPFILHKLKPNKWVILALIVILFAAPILLPQVYGNIITASIFFLLITILALSYVDTLKLERFEKNKPVVGKPKAKPNRAKNTK